MRCVCECVYWVWDQGRSNIWWTTLLQALVKKTSKQSGEASRRDRLFFIIWIHNFFFPSLLFFFRELRTTENTWLSCQRLRCLNTSIVCAFFLIGSIGIFPERWLLENWTRRSETVLDWHPVATLSHTMAVLLTQSAGNKNEYSKASHSFLSMKKGLSSLSPFFFFFFSLPSLSPSLSIHNISPLHAPHTHTPFVPWKAMHVCSQLSSQLSSNFSLFYVYFECQIDHRLVTSGVQYNANDTGPERIFSQKRR